MVGCRHQWTRKSWEPSFAQNACAVCCNQPPFFGGFWRLVSSDGQQNRIRPLILSWNMFFGMRYEITRLSPIVFHLFAGLQLGLDATEVCQLPLRFWRDGRGGRCVQAAANWFGWHVVLGGHFDVWLFQQWTSGQPQSVAGSLGRYKMKSGSDKNSPLMHSYASFGKNS